MDINIRSHVLSNMKGLDSQNISATITDAISSGEEKALPGLGVMFEVLWKNVNADEKQKFAQVLESSLK